MIWNDRLLFLHAPKTAGMSLTRMLMQSLHGHMFMSGDLSDRQKKQGRSFRKALREQLRERGLVEESKKVAITYVPGKRHETLCDAESMLTYRNESVIDFEKVFSVMRNPYDLELSRYAYLKKGLSVDKGPAQDIALNSSLREYLRSAPFFGMRPPRLHLYYSFQGSIPANLIILRYERLAKDIATYMSPFLNDDYALPFENRSEHRSYTEEYDAECEALCFNRHRWFFEKGFYEREAF